MKREKIVCIRFAGDELDRVTSLALAERLSRSAYIRRLILNFSDRTESLKKRMIKYGHPGPS